MVGALQGSLWRAGELERGGRRDSRRGDEDGGEGFAILSGWRWCCQIARKIKLLRVRDEGTTVPSSLHSVIDSIDLKRTRLRAKNKAT